MSFTVQTFIDYFLFFGWRDLIEIVFFSTLFYYFSLWLSTDSKKNLLFAFYGYWFVAFSSYLLQLTSITFFLITFCPLALALFILVHQEFLQRNFITLKNTITPASHDEDWLESLMRLCLHTINKNKEILIIIEQTDALDPLLDVPFHINTQLDHTLLTLLIDAPSFDQTKFIWINKQGRLLGINAFWKHTIAQEWFDKNTHNFESWKQDALALTHKTDAVIFGVSPLLRTFSIITQGKILEQLQGASALRILKKFLALPIDTKKGTTYGYHKENYNNQIHP